MSRRNSSSSAADLPSNLDPTVAALVQKSSDQQEDTNLTATSVRITIAQMKLQQSRVRGNSDYAAKVMDEAIAEGARDRDAWTLLDTHIRELEDHIKNLKDNSSSQQPKTEAEESKTNEVSGTDDPAKSDPDDESPDTVEADPAKVAELEQQAKEASGRADAMKSILTQCLQEEIEHVKAEQVSLTEREDQLRARIRSLQVALQSFPEPNSVPIPDDDDESNKDDSTEKEKKTITKQDLQNAMKDIHEHQSTLLKKQCTICHENTATRAVIPCGHLCLCNECTTLMIKGTSSSEETVSSSTLPQQQRQCPLCRGHLLSTLHIYTSK